MKEGLSRLKAGRGGATWGFHTQSVVVPCQQHLGASQECRALEPHSGT